MDLLASETARLVLSYTLDQQLPLTSKQLVIDILSENILLETQIDVKYHVYKKLEYKGPHFGS